MMGDVQIDHDATVMPSIVITESDGHALVYNRVTRELFDRVGDRISYVGRASGDTQRDIATWMRWMQTTPQ